MPGTVTMELTDKTFNEIIAEGDRPVLVDFWAEWCMPCRVVGPTVDQIAEEYQGKVAVAKFDVDQGQQTAAKLGITAIPSLILFKDGEPVDRLTGVNSKETIAEMIEKHLD